MLVQVSGMGELGVFIGQSPVLEGIKKQQGYEQQARDGHGIFYPQKILRELIGIDFRRGDGCVGQLKESPTDSQYIGVLPSIYVDLSQLLLQRVPVLRHDGQVF